MLPLLQQFHLHLVAKLKTWMCNCANCEWRKMRSDSIFIFVEEEMEILVLIHGVSTGPTCCYMAVLLFYFSVFAVNALK